MAWHLAGSQTALDKALGKAGHEAGRFLPMPRELKGERLTFGISVVLSATSDWSFYAL